MQEHAREAEGGDGSGLREGPAIGVGDQLAQRVAVAVGDTDDRAEIMVLSV